jgi:integrase
MRGSVQKKGDIYYAVVAIGPKRKWFKGGLAKKDAERVLTEKLGEMDNETYADIPKTAFSEYCRIWFGIHAESSLKPSTQKHYNGILKPLKRAFEGKKVSDITTKALQLYIIDRLKVVSARTIQSEIMLIRLLFAHARKWGYLRRNPAEDIDTPKYTKTDIDILEPDEMKTFLLQCEKEQNFYRIAFRTDIETGLRAGELWGLQWSDIDWENGRIHVRRSLWRGNLQIPKTNSAVRKVDISGSLLHELKRWRLACPVSGDNLVFPSFEGCRVNHENVMNRYFHPLLRRAV